MSRADQLLQELNRHSPTDALTILEAYDKKERETKFIRYWKPYPKQDVIFEKFRGKKIIGLLGGNRSGKTEIGAFVSIAFLLGKEFFRGSPAWKYVEPLPIPEGRPRNIWATGLDFSTLRDIIWREKYVFGRNHPAFVPKDTPLIKKCSESDLQIITTDGSMLTGKSADAGREKFQSASIDLAWIDEEPESEIFDEIYQRTLDCAGIILITLTPLTDISSGVRTPWVFDLYDKWRHGAADITFVQLSMLDNPFVPEVEKQKALEKWSGHPEERARLYGEFIQRSGLIYNQWDAKKHLIAPFQIPRDWPCIVSIDPAATGVTAGLKARIAPNDDIYLVGEYYEADLTVSDHAKNMLAQFGGPVDMWFLDPYWGKQRNAETHKTGLQLYRDNGIPARLPEIGSDDYAVEASREYIQATVSAASRHPKVYVFNDLHHFRQEIEHYVWAFYGKGEMKGMSKQKPVKRNDHLMNAFQYLCATHPRGKKSSRFSNLSEEERRAESLRNSYT